MYRPHFIAKTENSHTPITLSLKKFWPKILVVIYDRTLENMKIQNCSTEQ